MTDFTKLSPEDLARVTTRDGRKVEIITTKGRAPRPVVGYFELSTMPHAWGADGDCGAVTTPNGHDLILPPAPRVYYVNVYSGSWHAHDSERIANANSSQDRLALYRITDDGETATIEVIERNKGA